ncbi:MAG: hypothetical protein ACRDDY_03640 [Clostridium sp.]|uniref:hypothetical protein n=1 Tax=Clostridium sp. TaxID=1506 RepID=UPI003EE430F9
MITVYCCDDLNQIKKINGIEFIGSEKRMQENLTKLIKSNNNDIRIKTEQDTIINMLGILVYEKILKPSEVKWVLFDGDGHRDGSFSEEGFADEQWGFFPLSWDSDKLVKDLK